MLGEWGNNRECWYSLTVYPHNPHIPRELDCWCSVHSRGQRAGSRPEWEEHRTGSSAQCDLVEAAGLSGLMSEL